jgi:hypothetical protein
MRRYQGNASTPTRAAARVIRKHFGLTRFVTPDKAHAIVLNISRRRASGKMNDDLRVLCVKFKVLGVLHI